MAQHVPNWEALKIKTASPQSPTFNGLGTVAVPPSGIMGTVAVNPTMSPTMSPKSPTSPSSPFQNPSSPSRSPGSLNKSHMEMYKERQGKLRFTGSLQSSFPRESKFKDVEYDKGGCDFRTPPLSNNSSFGRMPSSMPHNRQVARVKFPQQKRWISEKIRSPGPVYGGPSSMGRQVMSHNATAGGVGFGTSHRDGSLKMYTNGTVAEASRGPLPPPDF